MESYYNKKVYRNLNFIKNNRGIIIQVELKKYRVYIPFLFLHEFEMWYKQLPYDKRTCHEVILTDRRKFILDIDHSNNESDIYMYDFERHITSRIMYVFNELDLCKPHILFYSMCKNDIISYHVVVTNMTFCAQTCLGLCLLISYGQIWSDLVDKSVYKTIQHIRLEGSTKYNQYRWKTLSGLDTPLISRYFTQGILSNIKDVKHSNINIICHKIYKIKDININTDIDITYLQLNFKIRKITNSCVYLNRIRSSFCIQCKRVHSRENAIIRYINNNPVFYCWRFMFV